MPVSDDPGHQPVHAQRASIGGVGDDRPADQTLNPIVQDCGVTVGERGEQLAGDPVGRQKRKHPGNAGEFGVGV